MGIQKLSQEKQDYSLDGVEIFVLNKALQIAIAELLKTDKDWSNKLVCQMKELPEKSSTSGLEDK